MAEKVLFPDGLTNRVKLVVGEVALDGSNPTAVTINEVDTIVGVTVSMLNASAPALGTSVITYAFTGNVLSIYAWKPTGAGDTTLVASTGTETVSYVVMGY